MSEQKILWYLSDYSDEVVPHKTTLDGAAYFLMHGKASPDDPDTCEFGGTPLVEPGATVALSSLTLLSDRRAVRREVEGGAFVWDILPPVPPNCHFMALRYGSGASWDADTICNPHDRELDEFLSEWAEGDEIISDIAIGRDGSHSAVFEVVDGKPRLRLLGDPPPEPEAVEKSEGTQGSLDLGGGDAGK